MEIHVLKLEKLPKEEQDEAELSAGCVSLERRAGGNLKKWLRKILIWKKPMKC